MLTSDVVDHCRSILWSCFLGKINMEYEHYQDLMVCFYGFVAKEEMACDEGCGGGGGRRLWWWWWWKKVVVVDAVKREGDAVAREGK
ncbi:hypothetical protein HanIR_Chr03g0119541 [Helianthus annuus]|nr:hypothetical protein HanIR_Chr03g0119541 [Helianthus annuus]